VINKEEKSGCEKVVIWFINTDAGGITCTCCLRSTGASPGPGTGSSSEDNPGTGPGTSTGASTGISPCWLAKGSYLRQWFPGFFLLYAVGCR